MFVGSKELLAAFWARHALSLFSARWRGMVGCLSLYQSSWPSIFQVVLANPLGRQLSQDIVQVVGVRVTVACEVGAKFCLVVNLVPHHRVRLARGAGRSDGKDEASVPGHDQQLQDLEPDSEWKGNAGRNKADAGHVK